MRYYQIVISGSTSATYTSYLNGATDTSALQIELDIPVIGLATPMGFASIRIWGVSLKTISQARDFNGASISVYGGMQKGLPFANAKQGGLLVQGTILQSFGNWVGTNQTLDLIIQADGGATLAEPKNIVLDWAQGVPLDRVITQTLKVAYPTYTSTVNINPGLVLSEHATGVYKTVEDFANYINQISKSVITTAGYPGVSIVLNGTNFNVFDNQTSSTATDPIQLAFTDLIGQPTWIDSPSIQFNTVMRADLSVGSFVKFPIGLVTTTAASQSQFRDQSAFQGVFQISLVRHVGSYRQPSADAWVTTFNAYPASPT